MSTDTVRDKIRLGFLTTLQTSEGSFVGGLLVTNHLGRPLEFQCTTPVKPNPTQQILYGPTLKPFILGELIGKTLIDKAGVTPDIVLTEQEEILELRSHVRFPVALVATSRRDHSSATVDASGSSAETSKSADARGELSFHESQASANQISPPLQSAEGPGSEKKMRLGKQWLRFHDGHHDDEMKVGESAKIIPRDADLLEPFERIREALLEASRNGAGR